jgi:hypothetical protein
MAIEPVGHKSSHFLPHFIFPGILQHPCGYISIHFSHGDISAKLDPSHEKNGMQRLNP